VENVLSSAASSPISRNVIHRTREFGHGPIVRLMSSSELGEHLKPFVFLDLLEADMRDLAGSMTEHPHSGIATITVFTEDDVTFDDPRAGVRNPRLRRCRVGACRTWYVAQQGTLREYVENGPGLSTLDRASARSAECGARSPVQRCRGDNRDEEPA
jgi:hypothetical protein